MIKMKFVPTTKRVELNTKKEVNEKISDKTIENIKHYEKQTPDQLIKRLNELNHEFDTERVLETTASVFILLGSILAIVHHINWIYFVFIISFFLLIHALIGWCPPLPIIRRIGVRSQKEIDDEKMIVLYLLGEFKQNNAIHIYQNIKKD